MFYSQFLVISTNCRQQNINAFLTIQAASYYLAKDNINGNVGTAVSCETRCKNTQILNNSAFLYYI